MMPALTSLVHYGKSATDYEGDYKDGYQGIHCSPYCGTEGA